MNRWTSNVFWHCTIYQKLSCTWFLGNLSNTYKYHKEIIVILLNSSVLTWTRGRLKFYRTKNIISYAIICDHKSCRWKWLKRFIRDFCVYRVHPFYLNDKWQMIYWIIRRLLKEKLKYRRIFCRELHICMQHKSMYTAISICKNRCCNFNVNCLLNKTW